MKFAEESIASARLDGLETLQRAHWREVGIDQDAIPLAVDWDRYAQMEEAKTFRAMTMRTDEGQLVGYNAFFVVPHMHYRDAVFAMNDVVYVLPDHRGVDGLRLILRAEKWLGEMGVAKIVYHSKDDIEFGAGEKGDGHPDSLDRLGELIELEEELGMELPDAVAVDNLTLGGLLEHLGYSRIETSYGKLLKGSRR